MDGRLPAAARPARGGRRQRRWGSGSSPLRRAAHRFSMVHLTAFSLACIRQRAQRESGRVQRQAVAAQAAAVAARAAAGPDAADPNAAAGTRCPSAEPKTYIRVVHREEQGSRHSEGAKGRLRRGSGTAQRTVWRDRRSRDDGVKAAERGASLPEMLDVTGRPAAVQHTQPGHSVSRHRLLIDQPGACFHKRAGCRVWLCAPPCSPRGLRSCSAPRGELRMC